MEYTVYIIQDKTGKLYKGITSNIEKRLNTHNMRYGGWTKNRKPFTLVYSENGFSKSEALKREKFFKSGQGREFLKKIISGSGAAW